MSPNIELKLRRPPTKEGKKNNARSRRATPRSLAPALFLFSFWGSFWRRPTVQTRMPFSFLLLLFFLQLGDAVSCYGRGPEEFEDTPFKKHRRRINMNVLCIAQCRMSELKIFLLFSCAIFLLSLLCVRKLASAIFSLRRCIRSKF